MCKQISCNSYKNKNYVQTIRLKTYMYIHLSLCEQMTDFKLLLLPSNTWNQLTVCKQMINSKQNYSCWIEILEIIKLCA